MPQNLSRLSKSKTDPFIQYIIYTFHHDNECPDMTARWQKHSVESCPHKACVLARTLYETGEYAKIEISRLIYDRNKKPIHKQCVNVIQKSQNIEINALGVLSAAMICAAAAFSVALFLTGA